MNFLSIDCSTEIGSLFIKTKNKTFIKVLQSDKFISDLLVHHILDFIKENDLKFEDFNQIYVNQGPGNFSSLRSSLSIAKGISLSKNLRLFGYDNFIWPCVKFYNKSDYVFSFTKVREKYYVKKFDKELNTISEPKIITQEDMITNYNNEFKVIPKNISYQFSSEILKLSNLSIVDLNHNELEFLQFKGLLDDKLIKPLYLT